MTKKKNKENIFPLSTKVYCIHNSFFTRESTKNTTIKIGRVYSYKRFHNDILPVIKEVGIKNELDAKSYKITNDFKEAYNWLKDSF